MSRKSKPKKRYGMMYFKVTAGGWDGPDKWGSTNDLKRAYGWCAFHIAQSDLDDQEARKAAVYDRRHGRIDRTYTRTAAGIIIKDH